MNQTETIHPGHQDVSDHQRRTFALDSLKRFLSIPSCHHAISLESQGCFQQFQDVGNIFYNEQITWLDTHKSILTSCSHFANDTIVLPCTVHACGKLLRYLSDYT